MPVICGRLQGQMAAQQFGVVVSYAIHATTMHLSLCSHDNMKRLDPSEHADRLACSQAVQLPEKHLSQPWISLCTGLLAAAKLLPSCPQWSASAAVSSHCI